MIKLVNILKEIESKEQLKKLAYSWQKPDGTFIPVKREHGLDALKHVGGDPKDDNVVILWKRGWQRIFYYGTDLNVHNEFYQPNDKQKVRLIELAIQLGFEKVEWDGGDKGDKILWSVHDVLEESIQNLSRTKRLIPLIKLARQYNTFENFYNDYQFKNYHGIYWHLTNNPNFRIDPKHSPSDLSSLAIGGSGEPGLTLSTDLGNWYSIFKKSRKYAAQIDLSDLKPNVDYRDTTRQFGHEIYVFKPEKVRVVKVYPIKNAMAINLRDYKKVLPQSIDELKKLYYLAKQG